MGLEFGLQVYEWLRGLDVDAAIAQTGVRVVQQSLHSLIESFES